VDVEALFLRGKEAADAGNYDYAIAIFLDILKIHHDHLRSRRALRGCAMQRFQAQGGAAKIKAMLKGAGHLIKAYLPCVSPAKAVQACEQYLASDPTNMSLLRRAAALYTKLGLLDAAADTLEFARQRRPGNLGILRQLGDACAKNRDYEKAMRCFQEIVRIKPTDRAAADRAKETSALWHLERSHMKEAKDFTGTIRDKDAAEKLEKEGRVARTTDEKEARIATQQGIAEQDPDNPAVWRDLGRVFFDAEQYAEAERAYAREFKISSRIEARLRMGDARRRRLMQIEQAAVAEAEDSGNLPALLGKVKTARGQRLDFCIKEWLFRREKYPTELRFAWELGNYYFERAAEDDIQRAIGEFQRAIDAPGLHADAQLMLARCFALNPKTLDMAEELLQKALAEIEDPGLNIAKEMQYELGEAKESLGKKDEAVACYKKIYAIDAGFKDVAQKIQVLT